VIAIGLAAEQAAPPSLTLPRKGEETRLPMERNYER